MFVVLPSYSLTLGSDVHKFANDYVMIIAVAEMTQDLINSLEIKKSKVDGK